MNHLKILSFFIAFGFSFQANATHVMGADITYKAIDSLKYEISITYYRWCNGVGIPNPSSSTRIRCISGVSTNVSLSLKSITEITELCDTAPRRCNPANTYGTGEGVEKHVYTAIIDFTSSPYNSLVNCGTVIIETGQCCRNSSINTGASNSNFYTYAEIILSQSYNNSSPTFTSNPKAFLCCNQPAYLSVNAIDTVDHDSISYAWASPKSAYSTNIGYSGSGYAYNHPFKAYYPGNLAPPYRNANANPPIGITLDPKNGELIFTPTRCNEETVACWEITEWRKDSSGVYQKIGSIRRDVQFITKTCPDNNPPTLNGPFEYGICEGNTLCFDITTNDIVFTPPPPSFVTSTR